MSEELRVLQQNLMMDLHTRMENGRKVLNRLVAARHLWGYGDDDSADDE